MASVTRLWNSSLGTRPSVALRLNSGEGHGFAHKTTETHTLTTGTCAKNIAGHKDQHTGELGSMKLEIVLVDVQMSCSHVGTRQQCWQ